VCQDIETRTLSLRAFRLISELVNKLTIQRRSSVRVSDGVRTCFILSIHFLQSGWKVISTKQGSGFFWSIVRVALKWLCLQVAVLPKSLVDQRQWDKIACRDSEKLTCLALQIFMRPSKNKCYINTLVYFLEWCFDLQPKVFACSFTKPVNSEDHFVTMIYIHTGSRVLWVYVFINEVFS